MWVGLIRLSLLLTASHSISEAACPNAENVSALFESVHARAWSDLTPETLPVALEGLRMQVIDDHLPGSLQAQSCPDVVVSTNRAQSARCFVWAVFERQTGETCGHVLQSFTFRSTLQLSSAMHLVTGIQYSLKAGGRPEGNQWDMTYVWRSKDSKSVFELVTEIKIPTQRPTPDTIVDVMVRLRHSAADPEDIDKLPFERGVFLPDSTAH